MQNRGRDFAGGLREAQRLGYAEADPSFDVEGIDAAHKLTILAAIAFGIRLQFDRVYSHFFDREIPADAKRILQASIDRYVAAIGGIYERG